MNDRQVADDEARRIEGEATLGAPDWRHGVGQFVQEIEDDGERRTVIARFQRLGQPDQTGAQLAGGSRGHHQLSR